MLNREGLKYLGIEGRAIDRVCFKHLFQDGREQACDRKICYDHAVKFEDNLTATLILGSSSLLRKRERAKP